MSEILLYETLPNKTVRCSLCRHHCVIPPGARGICRVRINREGAIVSLVDGLIVASNIDPIEKKPLYHMLPGSKSYSLASAGCNFSCSFCQNADIAKYNDNDTERFPGNLITPAEAVQKALASNCQSISYTYTEPTVWFEFALATARLAASAGLYNLFVTNGYITSEALGIIAPVLHAANIDLKGMTERFYSELCGARLSEVLNGIRDYKRRGIWLEITTLIIPGKNDDINQLNEIARFIADELGPDTPWHISRFFPRHRMANYQPTPSDSMRLAIEAGDKAGLRYIYEGNVDNGRENTFCPYCGALIVGRNGYRVTRLAIRDGSCGTCGKAIAGIWGQTDLPPAV